MVGMVARGRRGGAAAVRVLLLAVSVLLVVPVLRLATAQPHHRPGPDPGIDCNETALLTPCDALSFSSKLTSTPSPSSEVVISVTFPNPEQLCSPACLQPLATCGADPSDGTAAALRRAALTCRSPDSRDSLITACATSLQWHCGTVAGGSLCSDACTALVDDDRSCGDLLDTRNADLADLCARSPSTPDCLEQLTESRCFGDDPGLLSTLRALSSARAPSDGDDANDTAYWTASAAFCSPSCVGALLSDCGADVFGPNAGATLDAHCSACSSNYNASCGASTTLLPPSVGVNGGDAISEELKDALASPLWRACSPACVDFLSESTECVNGSAELGAAAAETATMCSAALTSCIDDVWRDCGGREPGAELSAGLCSPACTARLLNQSDSCFTLLADKLLSSVDLLAELPQVCEAVNSATCSTLFRQRCEANDGTSPPSAICSDDCVALLDGRAFPAATASCSPLWVTRLAALADATSAGDLTAIRDMCPHSLPPSCISAMASACGWSAATAASITTATQLLDAIGGGGDDLCGEACSAEVSSNCSVDDGDGVSLLTPLLALGPMMTSAQQAAVSELCVSANRSGVAHSGVGYLVNCTVFADANGNGVHDPSEAYATTSSSGGGYELRLLNQLDGPIRLLADTTTTKGAACMDAATLRPPALPAMSAPSGCRVLSPLSWLAGEVIQVGGTTMRRATTLLSIAFDAPLLQQVGSACEADALYALATCDPGGAVTLLRAEHYVTTLLLVASAAFAQSPEMETAVQPRVLTALATYLLDFEALYDGNAPSAMAPLAMYDVDVVRSVLLVLANRSAEDPMIGNTMDGNLTMKTMRSLTEEVAGLATAAAASLQVINEASMFRRDGCVAQLEATSLAATAVHARLLPVARNLSSATLPALVAATSPEELRSAVASSEPLAGEVWPASQVGSSTEGGDSSATVDPDNDDGGGDDSEEEWLDTAWGWPLLIALMTLLLGLIFYLIVCVCSARRPCCGLLSGKRYSTSSRVPAPASLLSRRRREQQYDPEVAEPMGGVVDEKGGGRRVSLGAVPTPDRGREVVAGASTSDSEFDGGDSAGSGSDEGSVSEGRRTGARDDERRRSTGSSSDFDGPNKKGAELEASATRSWAPSTPAPGGQGAVSLHRAFPGADFTDSEDGGDDDDGSDDSDAALAAAASAAVPLVGVDDIHIGNSLSEMSESVAASDDNDDDNDEAAPAVAYDGAAVAAVELPSPGGKQSAREGVV